LEEHPEGALAGLMPEFPPRSFPLSVVYPSRRNLPLRTRAVIEFLTEVVRADPAMSNHGASFSTRRGVRCVRGTRNLLSGRASAYTASTAPGADRRTAPWRRRRRATRQLGIAEEGVPHAFVHVKLRVDASLHQQSVAAQN